VYDEPFADSSQIPTSIISRFARSRVTVCLSGDGGDELFGGYNRYLVGRTMCRINRTYPAFLRRGLGATIGSVAPRHWDRLYQAAYSLARRKGGANFGDKMHKASRALTLREPSDIYRFLSGYWQEPTRMLRAEIREPQLRADLEFDADFVKAGMQWDQSWYLPGDNLVKTDRASMASSLEMRIPLLDKEIVEFSWKLPTTMNVSGNRSKWIMRELLGSYVPNRLTERPKMGFSVPIDDWLRNDLRDWTCDLLSGAHVGRHDMLDSEAVSLCLDEHLSERANNGNKLWALAMLQAWFDETLS
jgi:asparagine synthase (glutamine-hydrolysing)